MVLSFIQLFKLLLASSFCQISCKIICLDTGLFVLLGLVAFLVIINGCSEVEYREGLASFSEKTVSLCIAYLKTSGV